MLKEVLNPETVFYASAAFSVLAMAFTAAQKQWILERDGHSCQATQPHECNQDKYPLEVHHLICQRYAYTIDIDPDFPENGISFCREAHDLKHPDRVGARHTYRQGKAAGIDTFKELGYVREKKLKEHVIYWDDSYDRTDITRAIQLTQKAEREGKIFPTKQHRKERSVNHQRSV